MLPALTGPWAIPAGPAQPAGHSAAILLPPLCLGFLKLTVK